MRLLYQSNNGKEDMYPDRGIFLWQVGEVHGSRPRLGVRSGRILTVEFTYDGSQDTVEFIVDNPEKWSKTIKEWATHAHDRNAGIDRTIDEDLIRNREEKNRSDITLSPEFFESITGFRKFDSGGEEHSMNEKRCNKLVFNSKSHKVRMFYKLPLNCFIPKYPTPCDINKFFASICICSSVGKWVL